MPQPNHNPLQSIDQQPAPWDRERTTKELQEFIASRLDALGGPL